jgi:uncharacterized protein YprB with RNaseH-like and TPR domain
MLAHTFCHVPGIGEETECRLWSTGVTSWDLAIGHASIRPSWTRYIQESIGHYENRNVGYFADNLPSNQHWRLYWDFRGACAFVDIETTGFWPGEITTAVLYDGRTIRHYVNGDNLNEFPRDIKDYALLVTYNGKTFDIPFIERFFRIRLSQAHIDLRYMLHGLGLKGGLKGCERQLGIARPGLEGVDGLFAVLLWQEYRRQRNVKALETLLAYNIQDTLSLHSLMNHAHNQKVTAMPSSDRYCLPTPQLPKVPFAVDRTTVERLLAGQFPTNSFGRSFRPSLL